MLCLPKLPYGFSDLEPFLSTQTLEIHYGKHHQTYLDSLNQLLANHEECKNWSLEEIIRWAWEKGERVRLFNSAAQVWNHTFFWNSITSLEKKKELFGKLHEKIQQDFGSIGEFTAQFKSAALAQFGSGWVWLIWNSELKNLQILATSNAETPLVSKTLVPLLVCDVWEHAYYLDYQNRRGDFVDRFLRDFVNWEFAEQRFCDLYPSPG
jgi:Fe-Mn family superoxide dismutase